MASFQRPSERRLSGRTTDVRLVITGSSGHLGEALVRALRGAGHDVIGVDLAESAYTDLVGSVTNREVVRTAMAGADAVVHAATLHKPHVGTHSWHDFVDTNVTGTLNLLEEAVAESVGCFVLTSTTSVFGRALMPGPAAPAVWITEEVTPVPRNIYGLTKKAAEELVELAHQQHGLPCVILRTSRFFAEPDDQPEVASAYQDANTKVNELLYRRVDLEDVVTAHTAALERANDIGFGRYIVSATTPFTAADLGELRSDARAVVRRYFADYETTYEGLGWKMFPSIDRVYVNQAARAELAWTPRYDFPTALDRLRAGLDPRSPLAIEIGAKGYHQKSVSPYTWR